MLCAIHIHMYTLGWVIETQLNLWPDLLKWSYTCRVSIHSFHCHLIVTYINGPTAYVFNAAEGWTVAFTQVSFSCLSDIHECLGGLQMVSSSLDKQIADCDSPHDWLMSLAMDLAALCDTWRWKWHQWMLFGCYYWRHRFCPPLCGSLLTLHPPAL